ncbi:MAG TPA: glycine cleavage system protein GcvH [Tepidisphaeraceae bacterium]|nr:glycine cleavage system protein GcvH [Tepidisphaeraceae bacterium]
MSVPTQSRFLPSHEWHDLQGDTVTIGITQFAADELTDITYVALPKVGTKVQANQRFGEIESVKTSSDLYSGVSGTVLAVNDELTTNPGLVNSDPHKGGWIVKIKADNPAEMQKLLSADDYQKKTGH